ncbi:hypothetical protein WAX74_05380 [Psychrobacillus sp. FJAT-51614]|uniref:Uncharacterized protein n=1 Tax=Psychrobacillus mangrovi TaxID=3117745 RepID=A0ABU8F4C2_9BACI
MSEELNEEPNSKRELWNKKMEKLNKLPHMKQHNLTNGWKLFTNAEFTFWNHDPNYLIVDEDFDTVCAFYFKEDIFKVKKIAGWNVELTINSKKQHVKLFRKSNED